MSLKRTGVLHKNYQCDQMHVQAMVTCFKNLLIESTMFVCFHNITCNMKLCYNNTPLLENSVKRIDTIRINFELVDSLLRNGSIIRRLLLYAKL